MKVNDDMRIVQVATGENHVLALRANSTVIAWGGNDCGQCDVPDGLRDVVQVAAGYRHSLAVTNDGRVVAWGANDHEQCDIPDGLKNVKQIVAGTYHSLVLTNDGQVVAWGANDHGQCNVPDGLKDVAQILLGTNYSLVLTNDGRVVAWGANDHGQCDGPGDEIDAIPTDAIPSMVSLLDLMNVDRIERYNVLNRWHTSTPWNSLAVPIGLGAGRLPITLDVQRDGPHGLGAGTTGSGKSEFLLTYIAMIAANYSPNEVVFLLLDLKGDGMTGRVAQLPHVAGVLSNLSASLTNRILVSINAELNKRQRVFKQYGVNNINDYLAKRKQDASLPVLPIILIIADEFAQLKDEYPEFIDQLVGAARIGRSLGVRLLLSTQNPSGVVTKQISTNTSYRFCFKVASRDDSIDLIGNPDAAYLPGRGSGFLKIGEFPPFRFQSGYSGLLYERGDSGDISEHDMGASEYLCDETQLEYLIKLIKRIADAENCSEPYQVWTPPLSETPPLLSDVAHQYGIHIAWDGKVWTHKYHSELRLLMGIYDNPSSQEQGAWYLSLSNNHAGIVVPTQAGRTLFIRTFVGAIATQYAPSEVQCVFLDFGSRGLLQTYEQLPHTIAVTSAQHPKFITRIQDWLITEMSQRAVMLGGLTFAEYQQSQATWLPHIVIVIDNIVELHERTTLQQLNEVIEHVAQNGSSLGIHLVVLLNSVTEAGAKISKHLGVSVGIGVSHDMTYELTNKRNMFIDNSVLGRGVSSGINCEVQLATIEHGDDLAQKRAFAQMIVHMKQNDAYTTQHQMRETQ